LTVRFRLGIGLSRELRHSSLRVYILALLAASVVFVTVYIAFAEFFRNNYVPEYAIGLSNGYGKGELRTQSFGMQTFESLLPYASPIAYLLLPIILTLIFIIRFKKLHDANTFSKRDQKPKTTIVFLIEILVLCTLLSSFIGSYVGKESGYQAGYEQGYRRAEERNPSYKEVIRFIKEDKTDLNPYIPDQYDCYNFAVDTDNNAERSGIRCAYVYISIVGPKYDAHALIAFETRDKGLVFIEPQTDDVMRVAIGIRYWRDNGFGRPDYDDTITGFTLEWTKDNYWMNACAPPSSPIKSVFSLVYSQDLLISILLVAPAVFPTRIAKADSGNLHVISGP